MAERTSQAVPPAKKRTAAQAAIDAYFLAGARGAPLLPSIGSPAGIAPAMLANSPAMVAAPAVAEPVVVPAATPSARSPLFADRRAYRQQGYAPSDGFPIADAATAAVGRAGQVMGQNSQMQADLLAAPAAPAAPTARAGSGNAWGSVLNAVVDAGRAAFPNLTRVLGAAGSFGSSIANASDTDAIRVAEAAPATTATQAALAAGRAAPTLEMTPQDALASIISNALAGGATFSEIKGLGELVPAAIKPSASAKDRAIGTASSLADTVFKQAYDEAQQLADPEAKKQALREAAANYQNFYAALSGVDPTQLAMAKRLANTKED